MLAQYACALSPMSGMPAAKYSNTLLGYEWFHASFTTGVPENPQYWTSLGVAYSKLSRIQDAATAIRKAIQLNPNDKAFIQQAEAFLRQLGVQ